MGNSKIALVIEGTYPWYRGGVSEWIAQYIQAFPDYDFHVVQIATDPFLQTELSNALYDVPGQVKVFERIGPPAYHKYWKTEAKAWFRKYEKRIHPAFASADIIHVANTGFAGWLGLQFAKKLKAPLILTEHALYWKEIQIGAVALECGYKVPVNLEERKYMATLFKQVAAEIYNGADEVVSVSRCNMADQRRMGARNIQYIPNGVKASWLQSQNVKNRNKHLVIGWIGRCAKMKNPLKFFEVVEAFKNHGYEKTSFIMMICDANEVELQKKVIKKAKAYPQIKLICNKPAEMYLDDMDALCITSYNESQPLVLFEALARKVLPIGWVTGDVNNEYGVVFPSDCPAKIMAKKVMQLWQQTERWKQEVDLRYQRVKQDHTWTGIFHQYRTLFRSFLKKSA